MSDVVINIFKQINPTLTILNIFRLTDDEYVVEAVENVNETNYNDPFYKVNVKTRKVTNYLPMDDLDRFTDATENGVIYKKR